MLIFKHHEISKGRVLKGIEISISTDMNVYTVDSFLFVEYLFSGIKLVQGNHEFKWLTNYKFLKECM